MGKRRNTLRGAGCFSLFYSLNFEFCAIVRYFSLEGCLTAAQTAVQYVELMIEPCYILGVYKTRGTGPLDASCQRIQQYVKLCPTCLQPSESGAALCQYADNSIPGEERLREGGGRGIIGVDPDYNVVAPHLAGLVFCGCVLLLCLLGAHFLLPPSCWEPLILHKVNYCPHCSALHPDCRTNQ